MLMIEPQEAQRQFNEYVWKVCRAASKSGPAVSWVGDKIYGCAGLMRFYGTPTMMWALFAEVGPRKFLQIHNDVAMLLSHCPDDEQIYAYVNDDFDKGHRWMKLLGFNADQKKDGVTRYARLT